MICATMDTNRHWYFLSWNVRGINSQAKWDTFRNKIDESSCNILSLQETKRENFDSTYIRKLCPRHLNQFVFSPSNSASDGLLTCWNGNHFRGESVLINSFSITMKFTSPADGKIFYHTIYGPLAPAEKATFISWL